MKKLWLMLATALSLFAYEKGDVVDNALMQKMGMESGKITVVDFFASWCASCKKEIPLISKANAAADKTKVAFIGVDVDKDIKKGEAFQAGLKKEGHLNFRVINDTENEIVKVFNPKAMPALFYIKEGKVVEVIYGAVDSIDGIILTNLKEMEL